MHQSQRTWSKLDQQLAGELHTTGAQTVQLVAHLTGWRLTRGTGSSGCSAALLRLQPTKLLVRRGTEESAIFLADPVGFTANMFLKITLAISLSCGLIMFGVRWASSKHSVIHRKKIRI